MESFRKASEIKKPPGSFRPIPEIKQVIKEHLMNFQQPVTVTSTLMALNRHGLNPGRPAVKKYLDALVKSGAATVVLNGNCSEYTPVRRGSYP